MKVYSFLRRGYVTAAMAAAILVWSGATGFGQAPQPAPEPSPAALAQAKEILTLKGALVLFSPITAGVIEATKGALIQSNPMLSKDLTEVAAQLKTDYATRVNEIEQNAYRVYASRFTEAELKDVLAFYKSALGQKVTSEEPKILDESLKFADRWAQQLSQEIFVKFRAEMKKRGHDM